jgi:hypothetical protein
MRSIRSGAGDGLVDRRDDGQHLASPECFAQITDEFARSAAMFSELGRVLTSPRCMNCHPAGDRPHQATRAACISRRTRRAGAALVKASAESGAACPAKEKSNPGPDSNPAVSWVAKALCNAPTISASVVGTVRRAARDEPLLTLQLQFDRHGQAADQAGQFIEVVVVRRMIGIVVIDHGGEPDQAFIVADHGQGMHGGGVVAVNG